MMDDSWTLTMTGKKMGRTFPRGVLLGSVEPVEMGGRGGEKRGGGGSMMSFFSPSVQLYGEKTAFRGLWRAAQMRYFLDLR